VLVFTNDWGKEGCPMEKNNPYIITLSRLVIVLLCSSLLVGCKVVLPNSYFKAREKTQKILAHNGFKGKVQVKLIKKVFLKPTIIKPYH